MRPGSYSALMGFVLVLGGCNAGEPDSVPVPPETAELNVDFTPMISCGMDAPLIMLDPDWVPTWSEPRTGDISIIGFTLGSIPVSGRSSSSTYGLKITTLDAYTSSPTEQAPPPAEDEQDSASTTSSTNTSEAAESEFLFPSGSETEKADVLITFATDCDGSTSLSADGKPTHSIAGSPSSSAGVFSVAAQPAYPLGVRALEPGRLDGILFNGVPIRMRDDCGEGCSHFINPMFGDHGLDAHHGHVQEGFYHYHGDPKIFYDDSGASGATIIGVAADGYPIFGPWIDENGIKRKVTPSYALRSGARTEAEGGGFYDGTFVGDYEYIPGLGDLDECNGARLGDLYGYFVTEEFPYLMNCLRAAPDPSFNL